MERYFKKGDEVVESNDAIVQGLNVPKGAKVLYPNNDMNDLITIEYISERTGERKTTRRRADERDVLACCVYGPWHSLYYRHVH